MFESSLLSLMPYFSELLQICFEVLSGGKTRPLELRRASFVLLTHISKKGPASYGQGWLQEAGAWMPQARRYASVAIQDVHEDAIVRFHASHLVEALEESVRQAIDEGSGRP